MRTSFTHEDEFHTPGRVFGQRRQLLDTADLTVDVVQKLILVYETHPRTEQFRQHKIYMFRTPLPKIYNSQNEIWILKRTQS